MLSFSLFPQLTLFCTSGCLRVNTHWLWLVPFAAAFPTDNEEDPHQEEDHSKDHTTDPQRFIIIMKWLVVFMNFIHLRSQSWSEVGQKHCSNTKFHLVSLILLNTKESGLKVDYLWDQKQSIDDPVRYTKTKSIELLVKCWLESLIFLYEFKRSYSYTVSCT